MPREPKPEWLARLRGLHGCAEANLRFNYELWRWEFILPSADGIPRSQFWGWFKNPFTGQQIVPDEVTGLYPFRDLDDAGMEEAIANLEKTYVANPHDGAGSPRKEVQRRIDFNTRLREGWRREKADLFVDMVADRWRRMRGGGISGWSRAREQAEKVGPAKRGKPLIEVVSS